MHAATLALGWLRGLQKLQIVRREHYISSISGGSWIHGPMYVAQNLDAFVGDYIPPSQCTLAALKQLIGRRCPINSIRMQRFNFLQRIWIGSRQCLPQLSTFSTNSKLSSSGIELDRIAISNNRWICNDRWNPAIRSCRIQTYVLWYSCHKNFRNWRENKRMLGRTNLFTASLSDIRLLTSSYADIATTSRTSIVHIVCTG